MDVPVDDVRRAEALGYHSVWTAEAYGSDALSPLACLRPRSRRASSWPPVVQIAARTPAATAMHALTIDALAGGNRVIIGSVSGPQIVEGWYGRAVATPTGACASTWRSCARSSPSSRSPTTVPSFPLPYDGPRTLARASR